MNKKFILFWFFKHDHVCLQRCNSIKQITNAMKFEIDKETIARTHNDGSITIRQGSINGSDQVVTILNGGEMYQMNQAVSLSCGIKSIHDVQLKIQELKTAQTKMNEVLEAETRPDVRKVHNASLDSIIAQRRILEWSMDPSEQ